MSDLREALADWSLFDHHGHEDEAALLADAARKTLDPITDEEVEAAAKALYESESQEGYDASWPAWEDPMVDSARGLWMDNARAALEVFLNGRWPER